MPSGERLLSLDVFRGLTMIWMISAGFGLSAFRDDPLMGPVARQFEHIDWHGVAAWDMIQPFFMFIVGVAMPFSFGRRWAAGETWGRSLRHVLRRCALLILFGLIARSIQAGKPVLDLINVLAQVSFTYLVAFLVLRKPWKTQAAVAFGMLIVTWALYQFSGFADPWAKNNNFGWRLDQLVLNKNWGGAYATFNCVPSAFNTVAGALAGQLLLAAMAPARKMKILAGTGVALAAAGLALDPLVPLIKKIWTPSFAIYSTGYCLLALVFFYWLCDIAGRKNWASAIVMVGSNSIFIYLFYEILGRWMRQTAPVFTGWAIDWWGPWGKVLTACAIIAFQIWVCAWLYRRKIFFKV